MPCLAWIAYEVGMDKLKFMNLKDKREREELPRMFNSVYKLDNVDRKFLDCKQWKNMRSQAPVDKDKIGRQYQEI